MKRIRYAYYLILSFIISSVIFRMNKRFILGKKVRFYKMPQILINSSSKIIIKDNTIINSSNYGYHINMHSKCKLYADAADAFIKIGENCRIHGTCIHAYNSITIGNNCLIAANTQIFDANGHELSMDDPKRRLKLRDKGKPIIIEDNVWIGCNVIILGGTFIGEGSVVAAGSIVRGHFEGKSIIGGNPAKLIKTY